MEREQLTPREAKPKPPDAPKVEVQPITLDNINGRLGELSEQNQLLTARLVKKSGEMADLVKRLADQAAIITKQAARIKELEEGSTLLRKGGRNGRQR